MPFVIDNSVICGWFMGNQATAYSDAIGDRLLGDRCVAPVLLQLEFANVLRAACKRRRMGIEDARTAVDQIELLPIDIDREMPRTGGDFVAGAALRLVELRRGLSRTRTTEATTDRNARRSAP
ncbi:type II toxin-antitoxin system VapC family toxin [Aromatoleum sp.]|uniref:type II toxin-antitoxin system VapC family toxin n=1 Tax=Aromatoleum sp. TaxID=2307007 RepID=UPI002FC64924